MAAFSSSLVEALGATMGRQRRGGGAPPRARAVIDRGAVGGAGGARCRASQLAAITEGSMEIQSAPNISVEMGAAPRYAPAVLSKSPVLLLLFAMAAADLVRHFSSTTAARPPCYVGRRRLGGGSAWPKLTAVGFVVCQPVRLTGVAVLSLVLHPMRRGFGSISVFKRRSPPCLQELPLSSHQGRSVFPIVVGPCCSQVGPILHYVGLPHVCWSACGRRTWPPQLPLEAASSALPCPACCTRSLALEAMQLCSVVPLATTGCYNLRVHTLKQPLILLSSGLIRQLLLWHWLDESVSIWVCGLSFLYLRRRHQQNSSVVGMLLLRQLHRPTLYRRNERSVHLGARVFDAPAYTPTGRIVLLYVSVDAAVFFLGRRTFM